MSPLAIVGLVGGMGTLMSLGLAGVLGWTLLNKAEQVGDLKGQNAAKQAVIDAWQKDADLSAKLVGLQTSINNTLTAVGQIGRETIINVPLKNAACNDEPVLAVTADSVRRTRDAYRAGRQTSGRGPDSAVRNPGR